MKIIDLRYKGTMDKDVSKRFDRIALGAQKDFNETVCSLQKIYHDNFDWWISSPLSRNNFLSPLFHYCCCIIFLRELRSEERSNLTILIDSLAAESLFRRYAQENGLLIKVVYRVSLKERILKVLRPWWYLIFVPFNEFFWFILCQVVRRQKKIIPSSSIILIDTFVLSCCVNQDRYYSGLTDYLTEKEREALFFVPTWLGMRLRDMGSAVREARTSERNFLFKEDYLRPQDYLYAMMHFFRVRHLGKMNNVLFFSGLNIFPLVREEIRSAVGFSQAFLALLNYRFAFRLKKNKVRIRLVVDWFENQAIDKGWNFGFRTFFPNTRTKGYQGFYAADHYMCVRPTKTEAESTVIPNEIAVIGKGAIEAALRHYPRFPVSVAPAFRFQHLWNRDGHKKSSDFYSILVALPIVIKDATMIVRILSEIAASLEKNVRVWLKPHPTTSKDAVERGLSAALSEKFHFIIGDFYEYLQQADLLISSMSSSCLESLARGTPVVIIGNDTGLTYNSIPRSVDSDIWRLCHNAKELAAAIQFYKNRTAGKIQAHKEEGKRIRESYFEPVTRDGIKRFLDLDDVSSRKNGL